MTERELIDLCERVCWPDSEATDWDVDSNGDEVEIYSVPNDNAVDLYSMLTYKKLFNPRVEFMNDLTYGAKIGMMEVMQKFWEELDDDGHAELEKNLPELAGFLDKLAGEDVNNSSIGLGVVTKMWEMTAKMSDNLKDEINLAFDNTVNADDFYRVNMYHRVWEERGKFYIRLSVAFGWNAGYTDIFNGNFYADDDISEAEEAVRKGLRETPWMIE